MYYDSKRKYLHKALYNIYKLNAIPSTVYTSSCLKSILSTTEENHSMEDCLYDDMTLNDLHFYNPVVDDL